MMKTETIRIASIWMAKKRMRSTENFSGSENSVYDAIMMDTCQYTLVHPWNAEHQE